MRALCTVSGNIKRLPFKKFSVLLAFFGDVVYLSFPVKLIAQCDPKVLCLLKLFKSCPRELTCPQERSLKSMNSHDVTFCWVELHTPYFFPVDKR